MSIPVIIPQIGQSIAEATIIKWLKKQGERVEKGESLVEIGTDKINTEIPAPETGIVQEILVQEGETVPVESKIAVLSESTPRAESQSSAVSHDPSVGEVESVQKKAAPIDQQQRYSPVVRRLAQEHGVHLDQISGTGAGGRVTKEDILAFVEKRKLPEEPRLHFEPSSVNESRNPEFDRVPMSRMRKLIAEHMAQSRRTAADVTTFFEIDMSETVRRRDEAKQQYLDQFGIKLTYLPFIIIAVVKALRAFPIVNASIEGDNILYKRDIHIGVAVALEDGLIVPVIRNAAEKNVLGLSRSLQDLSDRARNKRLIPEDLEGGTFTITNPGVFGALMGTPIIHQPQVAILGTGAVNKRPVVVDDAIAIRSMAFFSLSYDHRAMDGSTADRFLAHIKNTLETDCPPALE
jgi:2-oxoglutarate dehydrogenase complex dihydrolipoamide succinyltransferase (E2) component